MAERYITAVNKWLVYRAATGGDLAAVFERYLPGIYLKECFIVRPELP